MIVLGLWKGWGRSGFFLGALRASELLRFRKVILILHRRILAPQQVLVFRLDIMAENVLSKPEFIHFLMEKLSLEETERSSWVIDEANFAIKHGANTFNLNGNYEKCTVLQDKAERDRHLTQVASILRQVASHVPKTLDSKFEDVKDFIFPRIRETEWITEVNSEEKADRQIVRCFLEPVPQ